MGNGTLHPSGLTLVQYGIHLPNQMAKQWLAFVAAARTRHHVDLRITYSSTWPTPPKEIGGLGGYRSRACQQWMWDHRKDGGRRRQCARPGYSVHGTTPGCVDIYNHTDLPRSILVPLAAEFGLIADTVTGEPWHFQYNGTTISGGDVTPFPEPLEDPFRRDTSMTTLVHTKLTAAGGSELGPVVRAAAAAQGFATIAAGNFFALLGDGGGTRANALFTQGQDLANKLAKVHGGELQGSIELSPGTFNAWVEAYLTPVAASSAGGLTAAQSARLAETSTSEEISALAAKVDAVPTATLTEHAKRLANG